MRPTNQPTAADSAIALTIPMVTGRPKPTKWPGMAGAVRMALA